MHNTSNSIINQSNNNKKKNNNKTTEKKSGSGDWVAFGACVAPELTLHHREKSLLSTFSARGCGWWAQALLGPGFRR